MWVFAVTPDSVLIGDVSIVGGEVIVDSSAECEIETDKLVIELRAEDSSDSEEISVEVMLNRSELPLLEGAAAEVMRNESELPWLTEAALTTGEPEETDDELTKDDPGLPWLIEAAATVDELEIELAVEGSPREIRSVLIKLAKAVSEISGLSLDMRFPDTDTAVDWLLSMDGDDIFVGEE